jgi:predicted amidohydrolase
MAGHRRAVRVCVVQFDAVPGKVAENVDRLVALVDRCGPDSDLVVAPELATTGYDLGLLGDRGHELGEPADGPSLRRLADTAVRHGSVLVVGFLERAEGLLYDSVATIGAAGQVSVYRKTHLYPPEQAVFAAGNRLEAVDSQAGVLGPLICFEHAFPEVSTTLALAGAQILVIPSAVPAGYEHLLELRTRARSQDNQVFAIGCNMVGHGFCGRSLVADPRGEVIARAGVEEAVVQATLDLGSVERERVNEPALQLRRPELYTDSADAG